MADEIKTPEEEMDEGIYTLTDENGNEEKFELLCDCNLDGKVYYAFVPLADEEEETLEYVILRAVEEEDGTMGLVSIDDDEEFDRVADYIEDKYFNEIDYDEE